MNTPLLTLNFTVFFFTFSTYAFTFSWLHTERAIGGHRPVEVRVEAYRVDRIGKRAHHYISPSEGLGSVFFNNFKLMCSLLSGFTRIER